MDPARPIQDALRAVLSPEDRLVVLHSSIGLLRPPPEAGKWAFLRALRGLLNQGLTLALPTFTFGFCSSAHYHHHDSAPETGVLGQWFLDLDGVERSRHPIYSFAVAGPGAGAVLAAANPTTFGDDSVFGHFERAGARVVMLGCAWDRCTQLHRYEEEAQVPYREYKTFTGTADWGAGPEPVEARMFVRRLDVGAGNDFSAVERRLRQDGCLAQAPLFSGLVESVAVGDLARVCRESLAADPCALTGKPRVTAFRSAAARTRAANDPIRVALLGDSNLELVRSALESRLEALVPDRRIQVWTAPYGQVARMVHDRASELHDLDPNVTIFLDRAEDLAGVPLADLADPAMAEEAVARHGRTVAAWRAAARGPVVVARPTALTPSSWGLAGDAGGPGLARRLGVQLEQALAGLDDLHWLDLAHEAAAFAEGPVNDDRLWLVGRFPFSEPFSRTLANRLAGMVLAALGRTARLVVLDLDNTLWGGVLGEDGIGGIQLGGDYPGNAFANFQRVLKTLTARGIALAVCSKNDEAHAVEAMRSHPDMVLRPDALVGWRINWLPKPANVAELCRELSLGPASVLFIDDNPVERERMRAEMPEVQVLELPADPARYARALLDSPYLGCLGITAEDRKRVESYQRRRGVEALRGEAGTPEQFFASLGVRAHMVRLEPGNAVRAAQLMAKTNQFNTTTRRHERQTLEEMAARPDHDVWVIAAEDRFSPRENVGVMVVRWDSPEPGWAEVESYLLSCRVLGRGLEAGLLHWLHDRALGRGAVGVAGRVVETERNAPARSVFADAGFALDGDGVWRRKIEAAPALPSWLEVLDSEESA